MDSENNVDAEIAELREEIEHFSNEKEKIRQIVGSIGGVPTLNTKAFNFLFVIALVSCFVVSVAHAIHQENVSVVLMEIAIAAVSAKLIYMVHIQTRVAHFELWMLSSLEWRVNQIDRKLQTVVKTLKTMEEGHGKS